ncbi:hypothetical protein [Paenarthrobacter sp. PH39-S1]|uniref:hypothetical protein n=1 Tax=Micrococcaceae TaxID=1268 RepID=UPI0024B87B56|nr:hypothetical protein [Paenarthrobacter sp. PH39-S1]MDJ0358488.1 hypothetical protein [Paenarthrobacter sp. PH39-S1]MDJ0358543.1 hypothetical protein [Paenarthrobacter sp. PH39-S1]
MQSFDATPNEKNPDPLGSEESASDAESTADPNGAATQKPARKDADALPDGSGTDRRQGIEDQGKENGEQSFDAG